MEKITIILLQLDEYVSILKKIRKIPLNSFLNDKILIGSAKYYLQVSIECCLNVANHILSTKRYRAPKDYADTFTVLEEKKILKTDLASRLRQMAKFRNRLVHLYGEIDDANVHRFITKDLADIIEFKKVILSKFSD